MYSQIQYMVMNKVSTFKVCNLLLMTFAVLSLASSIQMEACGGKSLFGFPFATWMYLHCILGTLMFILVIEHLYLYFGKRNWITKVKGLKRQTKWLCVIFVILLFISIVAFIRTMIFTTHSPIGAVHGKIGFLFMLFCIRHIAKRWKWVKKQIFKSKK